MWRNVRAMQEVVVVRRKERIALLCALISNRIASKTVVEGKAAI
jgi:hypothetical protein